MQKQDKRGMAAAPGAEPPRRRPRRYSQAQWQLLLAQEAEEKQQRPVISSVPSSRGAFPLPTESLLDIAHFLPVQEQFGHLRAVSRDLHRRLPAVPIPDPIFLVVFVTHRAGVAKRYIIGVFHLSKIATLLKDIEDGRTSLEIYQNYTQNRLHFFRMDVDSAMGFELRDFISDTEVGLEDVDPALRERLHTTGRPRLFRDLIGIERPDEDGDPVVSINRILLALYLAQERHERYSRNSAEWQLAEKLTKRS